MRPRGRAGGATLSFVGAPLRIGLCGALRVELGGEQIEDELSGRQGREVFAYLVLNRGRAVSRDALVALLWPERPPRAPEAALNTILARLRRVLGHSTLAGRAQLTLDLGATSWIDVQAAEDAARRAEVLIAEGNSAEALDLARSAFELVAAPLLPDIQHAWIDQWRSEVDDICIRLLAAVARGGLELGGTDLVEAERAARRLIDREPFRESGYALLMEVHAARGDVAEALLVYERLRRLLREELGIPPSARVASLHERLVTKAPNRSPAAPQVSHENNRSVPLPRLLERNCGKRLVGRKAELAGLLEHWHALGADNRGVVALAGEAGIGKTMLASSLACQAFGEGALVLYGRADEEALIPYAPLVEALRQFVVHIPEGELDGALGIHLGELGWLIPELASHRRERSPQPSDARVERLRLYHAVAALIGHAASRQPVLLVLEDMQCADKDTLLMVRQLLRDCARRRIAVVLTYRDGEVGVDHPLARLLSDIRRDLGVTHIVLRGLEDDDIAELWGQQERPSPEVVRQLHEQTSGNPFFIEEIARSVRETGSPLPGRTLSDLPLLADGIQDIIRDRVRRVDASTREALSGAAVLGQDFDLELLEAVLEDDSASQAIDVAVNAGLVIDDDERDGRCRFRHALGREAILFAIGRGRRAHLHLRTARALERRRDTRGVEPAELAHHYVESNRSDAADEAIDYSCQAAERARTSRAYDDATRHYRVALDVLERHRPHDTAMRGALLLKLGGACWQASGPSARVIFEQAVAVTRGLGEPSRFTEATLGLGGRFYAPTGPDEPYIHLLEEALNRARSDDALRTRLLGRLAEHLVFVNAEKALQLSEQALVSARQLDDPKLLVPALLSRHAALLHVEHRDERRRVAREEVELARDSGERELEALGLHWLLHDHLEAGDVAAACQTHRRLRELAADLRQPLYRHSALVWSRVIEQLSGNFERAAQLAHEALNVAQGAHGEGAKAHFIAQQLAVVQDQGGADRLLPAVEQRAGEVHSLWSCAARLLRLESASGSDVEREADGLRPERLREIPRDVLWLPKLAWLAEVSAHTGDRGSAAVIEELLAPYGDSFAQFIFNGSFGCVHRHLGLLAEQLRRPRQAADHFHEAVCRHAGIDAPALEARTLCDYAGALLTGRAAGTRHDAKAMVSRARALADECAATRTSERLTSLSSAAPPVNRTGSPVAA
jgi:DNA-binding SARP family transcriptional activator